MNVVTHSAEETEKWAAGWAQGLPTGSILCFFGELGAGKTTFIRGLVQGATGLPPETVTSPTFIMLNVYEGRPTIYHFDLYRLQGEEDFLGAGYEEVLDADGICCIEWSEKIASLLPKGTIRVHFEMTGETSRRIRIEKEEG